MQGTTVHLRGRSVTSTLRRPFLRTACVSWRQYLSVLPSPSVSSASSGAPAAADGDPSSLSDLEHRALILSDGRKLPLPFSVRPGNSEVHGLGVFACRNFSPREVIELCPVLEVSKNLVNHRSVLMDYLFSGRTAPKGLDSLGTDTLRVAFGYGMLYNHSASPNASHRTVSSKWAGRGVLRSSLNTKCFVLIEALRPIQEGEEILVHYGDQWWYDRHTFPPSELSSRRIHSKHCDAG
uniref:SET domain-containing protein n=1 Tax=Chromera velia CCMP2878 TaxID=1169474 RepID=A0A0G4HA61_9ALVE|mmetsp:Transcript_25135/g.49145  ORF Transcript_25135/g.49145 Transcript_25135/m.49145 type:complete len:237 (+) Transcript_25135:85-795(+)|eukprot:Cvel_25438.t1-p1 / transcript=Cvel_25438.t1 / gene=Cvel_25438 / organism=Chromera_velia_CCMP2878 / gene_product=hypothetical protein / transcript_product=hypothetical protein / location=Cvel_scaffold2882:237-2435(+) / protein_length=236 / sequence_SO=supercontig / SO=protein_coding / is_pseudo=false